MTLHMAATGNPISQPRLDGVWHDGHGEGHPRQKLEQNTPS